MNTIGNKYTEVTMKATDLRIGNLVLRKDLFDNKQKFKETIVCHNAITACYTNNDNFQPIPLTEEWLLKFGYKGRKDFKWNGSIVGIQIKDGKFYLGIKDLGNVLFHSVVEIKTVHHFQNLYYFLTNEELTYDIN